MDKKESFKILAIAVVAFFIFVTLAFIILSGNILPGRGPAPSTPPNITGTGLDIETDPTKIKENEQSGNVMSLLNLIPYKGSNFALFYNYDDNSFTLYVNPASPAQGNTEFEAFLRKNGVSNRSELYNLKTVSVMPTPQP